MSIAELLGTEGNDVPGRPAEIELTLPDLAGGPVASPWLDEDAPEDLGGVRDGGATVGLWTAPALELTPLEAVRLLPALAAASEGPPSVESSVVAVAADLRFGARAAELVVELVSRGRFVAGLEEIDGRWHARWRPVIGRQDRGRIEAMRWSMPASFVSDRSQDEHRGDDDPLRSSLWWLTDALVRHHASGHLPVPKGVSSRLEVTVEAWLSALVSPSGIVDAESDEVGLLAKRLDGWSASMNEDVDPVRTCFRIVPPPDDPDEGELSGTGAKGSNVRRETPARPGRSDQRRGDRRDEWRIEFALQSVDDPSLILPAATVWEDGPELVALERHVAHPDEHLLRGLGRAARIVPSLGPSMSVMTPCGQTTDAAGILSFLREGAPALEEAGFGVQAPQWWRAKPATLGLRLRARTPKSTTSSGILGLDSLCDVRWEVALGDTKIGLAELRQLARLKQPLVRIRGQWVELHENHLAAAISALDGRSTAARRMSADEVLRRALGLDATKEGLPVTAVEADGWLGELLAGAEDGRLRAVPTPEGFAGELRPYQERGLGWLGFLGGLGLGACLADDMGLGKTAQLLALLVDERGRAASEGRSSATTGRPASPTRSTAARKRGGDPGRSRRESGRQLGPTLVICPMSLVGNWQREAARFAPDLSVYVHHGPERLDGKEFTRCARRADLVLSTYGLAARDRERLTTVRWRRVVLDEAQQIKNSAARTTQAVRAIPADRRIAMTGTPVENRLSELWSIMEFLNPGILGSEASFRERFAVPIERGGDDEAAERLRRITGPFVLRRLKTDRSIIADLPDKLEMKEYCTLTREQASLYQAVVDDMLARIEESEGIERRGLILATMLKLKQVCNHPAQFLGDGSAMTGRSGKLSRLVEILEEARVEGDRSLVFTQFTQMGDMLARHLRRRLGCDVLWLHGKVSKKARDAMVARFQDGEAPIFLLSLKAGGTGLNLTAATHVVHFDRWWNPAVEDQATDRAFRIGQKRNVQVRKLVCGGTLEERIDAMIEQKRALAERIVGSGEGWITELTTEQLREVVGLSADAVGED